MLSNSRPSHPNVMSSDETTLLVPKVNWRRKCCKYFSRECFFGIVYLLLLVTDVVSLSLMIHFSLSANVAHSSKGTDTSNKKITSNETTSFPGALFFSPTVPPKSPLLFPIVPTKRDPGNETVYDAYIAKNADMFGAKCIFFSGIDTLNCWIFLGIVVTSPRYVVCCATLRNLLRLPRFWTLIFYFALYVTSWVILHSYLYPPAIQRSMLVIGCTSIDVLNAFTILIMVGILNKVKVRNLVQGHSRYKYLLLKGALFVFFIHFFCSLMTAIFSVFFAPFVVDNIDKVGSLTNSLTSFLILPFATKITDLIWTKILNDDECIIGKYKNEGFTRQMTLI
ncbi:hypothetical protein ACROYT_G000884 [Oculina patagonica]